MRTRVPVLLVLIAMLWQTMAWLTPLRIHQEAEIIAHKVVHVQASDHHHHDDAALHVEDHSNEIPHQHANEGVQPPGLAPALSSQQLEQSPPVLIPTVLVGHAPATPDRLLRPPRGLTLSS